MQACLRVILICVAFSRRDAVLSFVVCCVNARGLRTLNLTPSTLPSKSGMAYGPMPTSKRTTTSNSPPYIQLLCLTGLQGPCIEQCVFLGWHLALLVGHAEKYICSILGMICTDIQRKLVYGLVLHSHAKCCAYLRTKRSTK